jgi:hypothetical protein
MQTQVVKPNGHAHHQNAPREKVSFPANTTVLVTLEFDTGKLVAGKFGDQYQYFLLGEQIMWVDPAVNEAIVATGAGANDEIGITKRTKGAWEVFRVEEEPLPHVAAPGRVPLQPRAVPVYIAPERIEPIQYTPVPNYVPAPEPPAAAPKMAQPKRLHPEPPGDVADLITRAGEMQAALKLAIDAAAIAIDYAASHSIPITGELHFADVRAMAATLIINGQAKGGRK